MLWVPRFDFEGKTKEKNIWAEKKIKAFKIDWEKILEMHEFLESIKKFPEKKKDLALIKTNLCRW